jgi:hypothetical protein
MAIDPKLIDKLLAEHGHRPEDIARKKRLAEAVDEGVAGTS